jgi:molecular chaperone Hsp33
MADDAFNGLPQGTLIRNTFVRGRNVLVAEAEFTDLFVDYYLHCRDQSIPLAEPHDRRFKELLAAFALHGASRPRNEVMAWTVRFASPLASYFLAGDTGLGAVAGRVFTENVRVEGGNEFYQELKRPHKDLHRSYVDFEGDDARAAVERFYAQSEQRPGKLFFPGGDRAILVTAHPDFDEKWFAALDEERVLSLASHEEVRHLETRPCRWRCGCGHDRIHEILRPAFHQDPEELFGDEEVIEVHCPRCAARFRISREAMEASAQRSV